jgi:hypothetical protein
MKSNKTFTSEQIILLKEAYALIAEGKKENLIHLDNLLTQHPFLIKYNTAQDILNRKDFGFAHPPSLLVCAIQLNQTKPEEAYNFIDLLLNKGASINIKKTHYKKGLIFSPLTFTHNPMMMEYLMERGAKFMEKEYHRHLKVINSLSDGHFKSDMLKVMKRYDCYQEKIALEMSVNLEKTTKKKIKM